SGRDFHSTHHENGSFRFQVDVSGERATCRPYDGVPAVVAFSNGDYTHEPTWYRNFIYAEEQARGLDAVEDLASPGILTFSISKNPAVLMLCAVAGGVDPGAVEPSHTSKQPASSPPATESIEARYAQVRTNERRR